MKNVFLIFFVFILSCKEEPVLSTTGEISIQKLTDTKEFSLASPKGIRTTVFVVWIDGTLNSDITIQVYDPTGERLIIERIIPKRIYTYTTRNFRLDYYESNDVILKVIPAKGSEENFKMKWGIA
jgi:hypothetical protein